MQGHFDLQMLHTPGLTQELIDGVRREGGDPAVEQYLKTFNKDDEWHTDNLVYPTSVSYLYYYAMSASSMYFSLSQQSGTPTAFYWIHLATTSSEPVYWTVDSSNNYTWNGDPDNFPDKPSGIVTSTDRKIFVSGCIVSPDIKSDSSGREAIYGKFKWLYLPGECTSDQIRSINVIFECRPPDPYYYGPGKARVARVRIKDSGGNPVTINKLNTKSLLIEYTYTMVSI